MQLKKRLTWMVGGAFDSCVCRPLVLRSARTHVNIVYYHFIGDPAAHYSAFHAGCTLEKFEGDIQRLKSIFEFKSLEEVLYGDDATSARRKPALTITFDDGLNLDTSGLIQVLKKNHISATTFVITSCVDNQQMMWRHMLSVIKAQRDDDTVVRHYNALAYEHDLSGIRSSDQLMTGSRSWPHKQKDRLVSELWTRCGLPSVDEYLQANRPYFGWSDLERWLDSGHSVGFHTHTHPSCSNLTRDDIEDEIVAPARQLKKRLGLNRVHFSYPFGERLKAELEDGLFRDGVLASCLGTRGFRPKGTSLSKLERACAEVPSLGWSVFRPLASAGMTELWRERR
jgi:peptidoglycan/xylan/chitin deacetylase (PgdA/CDA1 family)